MSVRLMLDFNTEEAMADFLDEFMPMLDRHVDAPNGLAVWKADGLDYTKTSGVPRSRTYIIKDAADETRDERFVQTKTKEY